MVRTRDYDLDQLYDGLLKVWRINFALFATFCLSALCLFLAFQFGDARNTILIAVRGFFIGTMCLSLFVGGVSLRT